MSASEMSNSEISATPPTAPSTLKAWLLATRPATLSAAWIPVFVGSAVAFRINLFDFWPAFAALFGSTMIQIGTNFANDVFDYEKGADNEDRLGPTRAVSAGLISPNAMKIAMVISFVLASLSGVYLSLHAGPIIIAIGMISIICGIAYTGGPYPLAYHGLGDIFVVIFFGFVAVAGTTFVQSGTWEPLSFICSLPVGALSTAILVVNNVRDRNTDIVVNKKTLVARFGRRFGELEYLFLLLFAYGTPLYLLTQGFSAIVLAPFITLPAAIFLMRAVIKKEGVALNPILSGTAKLMIAFGLIFALSLVFA